MSWRILAVLLFASAFISGSCSSARAQTFEEITTMLERGSWGLQEGETSCAENPRTFRFSEDGRWMIVEWLHTYDADRYMVLYADPGSITTYIEGEERRTDTGDRVVWQLMMSRPDRYCWRRTDWPSHYCTSDRVICLAS